MGIHEATGKGEDEGEGNVVHVNTVKAYGEQQYSSTYSWSWNAMEMGGHLYTSTALPLEKELTVTTELESGWKKCLLLLSEI